MKKNFKKKILKNGLTILFEKRDLPIITIIFAVRNGTANESAKEKGISHFIEHMLYKGTKNRTYLQIAEEIEKKGGILNGFTSEETTAFWCKLPSEHLNVGLEVLTDMFKNSIFDSKEFEKERKVILEELKMNKDNPRRYVLEKIMGHLYENPFGKNDDEKTMNSITRKELLERFEEVFQPDKIIICVVGDANFGEIVSLTEQKFGDKKGKVKTFEIRQKNYSSVENRKGIDQANLIFGFHVPKSNDTKNYAASILNELMAGGLSSRLFVEIRQKRNLAYSVNGISDIGKEFGHNLIYVGTKKEHIGEVKEVILKEFEKILGEFDESELNKIKTKIIGNYRISMEDSSEQAMNLLKHEIILNAESFYDLEKKIKSVKVEDVKELAKKAIKKHSFFALIPE